MTFLRNHWQIISAAVVILIGIGRFESTSNATAIAVAELTKDQKEYFEKVNKRLDKMQSGQVSLCSAIQRRQGLSDFDCGSLVNLTVETARTD